MTWNKAAGRPHPSLPLYPREVLAIPLPRTVADCRGPGLCPKLGCRYNVLLDVTTTGTIRIGGANRGYGVTVPQVHYQMRNVRPSDLERAADMIVERAGDLASTCVLDYVENPDLAMSAAGLPERGPGVHMTQEEIAGVLGVTQQAVETTIREALAAIRAELDGDL